MEGGRSPLSYNLVNLFPSLKLLTQKPLCNSDDYVFFNHNSDTWISIHKKDVSARDYLLLSTLLTEETYFSTSLTHTEESWLNYLEGDGPSLLSTNDQIRIIQLSLEASDYLEADLKEAIQAFFDEQMIIIFSSERHVLLIEHKTLHTYSVDDFNSFAAILESDFYCKTRIYIGKFQSADSAYPSYYQQERNWFRDGISEMPTKRIFTMESIFPLFLERAITPTMEHAMDKEIIVPIRNDLELLHTVCSFFENGFNGSITAEKLHIHRNTLNYRLTKFQELTGISARSFNGALVAYIAHLRFSK